MKMVSLTVLRWALALVVAAGLAIDAYTHLDVASSYAGNRAGSLNQGQLFDVEAVLAILAGVFVLVRPRRVAAAVAFLVAGGGLALLLLYRYVDVGQLGPIPNMYEPVWYPEKTLSAVGEAVAAAAAALLFALLLVLPRRASEASAGTKSASRNEISDDTPTQDVERPAP